MFSVLKRNVRMRSVRSRSAAVPSLMTWVSSHGSTRVKGTKNGRFCLHWATMIRYLLLLGLPFLSGRPIDRTEKGSLSSLLSKAQYERFFPHHHPLYSYEAFVKAGDTFPLFAGEGDSVVRRRELAAFLAEVAHETGNGGTGSEGGTYAWGLYYTDEQGCQDGHCKTYNTGGNSPYHPAPGKSYYGRGPIQLTYAYNYGLAGDELG